MWFYFLENYNGKFVFLLEIWLFSDKELLFIDVLGFLGFVVVLGL